MFLRNSGLGNVTHRKGGTALMVRVSRMAPLVAMVRGACRPMSIVFAIGPTWDT